MQRLSLTPAPSTTSDRHLAAVVEIDASSLEPLSKPLLTTLDGIGDPRRAAREVRARLAVTVAAARPKRRGRQDYAQKRIAFFFIIGIFKIQSFQGFQRGDLCRKGYRPEQPPCQQGSDCWAGGGYPVSAPKAIGLPNKSGLHGEQQRFDTESARRTGAPSITRRLK